MDIELRRGDITTERTDVIVNAANSSLLGGGGVDGAIHRAAGPSLLAACRELRRTELPAGLPVGQAVATPGGRLAARWVIHTVGPNAHAGQKDPALLISAYASSLRLASELGAASVAFPAISAGVYGWPAGEVARCARSAVSGSGQRPGPVRLIRFVLYSDEVLAAFEREFPVTPLANIEADDGRLN